jgi:MFS family permease
MLQKIIQKLLAYRHPWRDVTFNELSEIYATMMIRSLAISMVGIFIPVYLYKLGYSLPAIMSVFGCYFTARIGLDLAAAYTTARIGPKHTLVIGQLMQIISSALFLTLPNFGWPLALLGAFWGGANSFFFIPFHIDFSKVKHRNHGGKELGFEQIMEKIGTALGPLTGGVVASVFGSRYIFLVSIVMLLVGLWPLFKTAEPVRIRQKLDFAGFQYGKVREYIPAHIGVNVENTLCLMLWPLFLALFVLPGDSVFARVGIMASVSVLVAAFTAHAIGRVVDNKKGRPLLRYSAVANSLVYIVRVFTVSYPMALATNVANEAITIGYRLPYTKGFYDAADDLPGHRIVFITSMEIMGCMAKAIMWWVLVALAMVLSARTTIIIGFAIAAIASMLITTEKFESLKG